MTDHNFRDNPAETPALHKLYLLEEDTPLYFTKELQNACQEKKWPFALSTRYGAQVQKAIHMWAASREKFMDIEIENNPRYLYIVIVENNEIDDALETKTLELPYQILAVTKEDAQDPKTFSRLLHDFALRFEQKTKVQQAASQDRSDHQKRSSPSFWDRMMPSWLKERDSSQEKGRDSSQESIELREYRTQRKR